MSDTGLARTLLDQVDSATRTRALDAVRKTLRADERLDGVALEGKAWLVTARRP